MDDTLRHRVEQRAGALERYRVAARHDQEVARPGAFHAAADRRVHHRDLAGGEHRMDPTHQGRRVGRVVDVKRAGLQMRDDAVRAEADRLHLRRPRQAGGDDIALAGKRRRRGRPLGAGVEQRRCRGAPQIMDDERVARRQQLPGDWCA